MAVALQADERRHDDQRQGENGQREQDVNRGSLECQPDDDRRGGRKQGADGR